MIIKLKEILTIYICPDHNEKYHMRKLHMDNLLKNIGFNNVIHYKSSINKYPFCLNNATIDIFSKYKPPFLLLEDDIQQTQDIPNEFEIPDDTDAFYLGLSNGGGHPHHNYDEGNSKFNYIKDNLFKVKNMLGGHAILYITSNYIMHLRNELITKPTYYNDLIMSKIQNKFNIYCHNQSYFYQSKELDGHEEATKITIRSPLTVTFVTAFININNSTIENIQKNYFYYFEKLAKTGIPIVLFLDTNYKEYGENISTLYKNVKIIRYLCKEELHITKIKLPNKLPTIRNIEKDNENYLKLMNNKIYFVEEAMNINLFSTEIFSWIDFRIFHIFNDDLGTVKCRCQDHPLSEGGLNLANLTCSVCANKVKPPEGVLTLAPHGITKRLQEISTKIYKSDINYFPGASDKKNILEIINWRFLGGFFIIDKNNINKLVNETTLLLKNINMLTWEVNIWAILEYNNCFNFGWYKADLTERFF